MPDIRRQYDPNFTGEQLKNECLFSTATALEMFPDHGFNVPVPTPLQAIVFSRPRRKPSAPRPVALNTYYTGPLGQVENYNGHIAPVIDGALIDLTAGQMARPTMGIRVPDVVIVPAENMPKDPRRFAVVTLAHGDTTVMYRAVPSHRTLAAEIEKGLDRYIIDTIRNAAEKALVDLEGLEPELMRSEHVEYPGSIRYSVDRELARRLPQPQFDYPKQTRPVQRGVFRPM